MTKLILLIVVAMAISLFGASVVFAQDSTQDTPGTAITDTICPTGGINNLEQMQQRHEAMGQNVPAEMQERHDAMSEALATGDTERIQELRNEMRGGNGGNGVCQNHSN